MAYIRSFFNGFEVTVLDFIEYYNNHGQTVRYARCYIKALNSIEEILLDQIEIK